MYELLQQQLIGRQVALLFFASCLCINCVCICDVCICDLCPTLPQLLWCARLAWLLRPPTPSGCACMYKDRIC
jgi:hypothetical protein